MSEDKFKNLRTITPYNIEVHRARIMFCIIGNEIKVGPIGTTESHLEWLKREGLIVETEENTEEFLNAHIRGYFLPNKNGLYAYIGLGFEFNAEVISDVLRRLIQFKEVLNLNNDTKICFGLDESPVNGIEYPQRCLGTLKELL